MRIDLGLGLALSSAVVLVLGACSKPSEPAPSTAVAGSATPASATVSTTPSAGAPATIPNLREITWDTPPGWQNAPNPSPIRKATLKIPKVPGDAEDAELSVTQVGGGVDANIKRWAGQFDGAPALQQSDRTVGDLKVTVVEGHGTFTGGGMPGTPASPKPGWALLGAIVGSVDPPYFFKLTGPDKTVAAARGGFDKLVASLRYK